MSFRKDKSAYNVTIKIMALAVACLLSVNGIVWAYPDGRPTGGRNALAAQSIFKPLHDAGIQDSAELAFEVLAGIRLLHAGKNHSTVNGILTETYRNMRDKRRVEFLPDVARAEIRTTARFKVIGHEEITFEIKYEDTRIGVSNATNRNAGDDVSVTDAGLNEVTPLDALTYGNVFQQNDEISIRRIAETPRTGIFTGDKRPVSDIEAADKNSIDVLLSSSDDEKLAELCGAIDIYVRSAGGLAAVSPQIRYALFRTLQNKNVLAKASETLTSISEASKKQLRVRSAGLVHSEKMDFSDVAVGIFSGMVEDGSFYAFCEEVQNARPLLFPGAAKVILIDSPGLWSEASTGLYRIASFLSLFGISVRVITAEQYEEGSLTDGAAIIGKRFITATIERDLAITKDCKSRFPGSLVVAGGQEATTSDRIFDIYPRIDCSVKRLGEAGMLDIVMEAEDVDGRLTEVSKGRILGTLKNVHTTQKPAILKPLSQPESRVLFQSYNPKLLADAGYIDPMNYILTTSHCPMGCIFCMSESFMTDSVEGHQKIVQVETDDIIERLRRIRQYMPDAHNIYFSDDNFFNNPARLKELIDKLKREGFDKTFSFTYTSRLDSLDRMPEELLRELAGSGAKTVIVGVESTVPAIVRSLGKGQKTADILAERYAEILQKVRKSGIPNVMAFMILFTPNETLDDTIRIMGDIVTIITEGNINISLTEGLSIFPGTELYDRYKRGTLEASTVTLKDYGAGPVVMPSDAMPRDPENRRLIKRKTDKVTGMSVVYRNDLQAEYAELKKQVAENITDISRAYALNTSLSAFYRIHLDLLLIEDMFLDRRSAASMMIQELRFKRDEWLSRQLSEALPDVGQQLSEQNKDEKRLSAKSTYYLKGYPVNMHIDLTPIAGATNQAKQNAETIARMITWHNSLGFNIRYMLEGDTKDEDFRKELGIALKSLPGINAEEMIININIPHSGNDVIDIRLKDKAYIGGNQAIDDREYIVALKDAGNAKGILIPNYTAASSMGLALAALRVSRDKAERSGKQEDVRDYEELRNRMLETFRSIYRRCEIIKTENDFSVDELELMVAGSSETKLYYTMLYAIPPVIKDENLKRINQYHENIHILQQHA